MDNLDPTWAIKTREVFNAILKPIMNERGGAGDPPADPPPADPPPADPPADPPPADPPADPPPAANWYDDMSADMKANPNIQKFKDKEGMAKSYLELQTLLGHEKVPIPKDENDAAAIAHFNKVIGVPEEAKGYDLKQPEPLPGLEDLQFGMDEFKALAHKHGLTPKQANGILEDYDAMLRGVQTQTKEDYLEKINGSKNELMKEWGLTYETKVKLAQSVMNKFAGSKEGFDHLNAKLGTDPAALKFLAAVGANFTEGSLGDLGDPATGFTKTPTQAKAEYDQIMNDPNDIYWSGVRNQTIVSESVRKERIGYVESLLRMQQPAKIS